PGGGAVARLHREKAYGMAPVLGHRSSNPRPLRCPSFPYVCGHRQGRNHSAKASRHQPATDGGLQAQAHLENPVGTWRRELIFQRVNLRFELKGPTYVYLRREPLTGPHPLVTMCLRDPWDTGRELKAQITKLD